MSGIGPALPPHLLAKRKRQQEEYAKNEPARTSGAKQSESASEGEKRRRVIGPAMPPAPLDQRPKEPVKVEESDSDDGDDGYGPALPPNNAGDDHKDDYHTTQDHDISSNEVKPQRDDWMMMPPKQDDLAARMDPTRLRARGFNTGKGAKSVSSTGDDSSSWHETPEQKRKRLQDEMMGIAAKPIGPQAPPKSSAKDNAAAKKIREHTEKTRGPSLLEQYEGSTDTAAEEDDPSQRAFDREKDMGSGMRIGHVKRQEMLSKASGFSSKFEGGNYL